MSNQLYHRQSEEHFRKLYAAVSQVYLEGKRTNSIIFLITLVSGTLIPVLLVWKNDWADSIGIVAGIIGPLVPFFLSGNPVKKAAEGANLQEQFDLDLYEAVKWNNDLVGEPLSNHFVNEKAEDYNWKVKLKDNWTWYSDYSNLEKSHAILECMKENLYWDKRQRGAYKRFVFTVTAILFLLGVLLYYLVVTDKTFPDYVARVFAPQLGLIVYLAQIILKNNRNVIQLEGKMNRAQNLYQRYTKSKQPVPKEDLREIQDAIFKNRQEGSLVPNWYYDYIKNKFQRTVTASAQDINQEKVDTA